MNENFFQELKRNFKTLDTCPPELWINFILKFCESYNYFAISQILVLYLHTEFNVSDIEAGFACKYYIYSSFPIIICILILILILMLIHILMLILILMLNSYSYSHSRSYSL
jgi:dipeptide/tripeptide permease